MQNQTEQPARTIITPQNLIEGMQEDRFVIDGQMLFQDLEFTEDETEETPRLDLGGVSKTPDRVLFLGCSFPHGLEMTNEEERGIPRIEIKNCRGNDFDIAPPASRLEIGNSELRNLVLNGMTSEYLGLEFNQSSIDYMDIYINAPGSTLALTMQEVHFHTIEITASETLTEREMRQLRIHFVPFAADLEDLDRPILDVSSRVITNIPQVARFFRLLCPTTPILFAGDMQDLL